MEDGDGRVVAKGLTERSMRDATMAASLLQQARGARATGANAVHEQVTDPPQPMALPLLSAAATLQKNCC